MVLRVDALSTRGTLSRATAGNGVGHNAQAITGLRGRIGAGTRERMGSQRVQRRSPEGQPAFTGGRKAGTTQSRPFIDFVPHPLDGRAAGDGVATKPLSRITAHRIAEDTVVVSFRASSAVSLSRSFVALQRGSNSS